ncbi:MULTISPECIES: stage IV sporulation protein A [unclassified Candidatus Frackibacter]|uniref:stage IV sporulation protein A n=1 Tax=unclassified Candidatus Frackibacter TaxID=2648818 RepID=UPI0008831D96|nr:MULTISPECIES: stage IV sporulation protein A [unclassified Candidatus Frackibacter]SDC52579.1 stage IV sporulation protein A [Candidatus Frackibacter sp. WG11]SEM41641.1 stage IV sporulation protein A [Candidatus Frackibacter sp. WG12]SFL76364.1 stage IV sporulation protein A [Candidatus Frackibacter sp. WG13]
MEEYNIYQDIADRTGGDIYIGVVGPVRTGKSTFIKKFMDLLVLPNIEDEYEKERTQDELPQSGGGRTIMTTEPKFVPNEGTKIALDEKLDFRVRLVDCVGYKVDGALGYEEEDGPRMVITPWFQDAIPFQEAAEIGTEKVIEDHSTIGLVVTTDGSITELPRDSYVNAEERVINELEKLGKPYLIALNSTHPTSQATKELQEELEEKYGRPVIPIDCANLTENDITYLLQEILYEFPIREINIDLPLWIDELEPVHWLSKELTESINTSLDEVIRLRDIEQGLNNLADFKHAQEVILEDMNLGTGTAEITIGMQENLFYDIIEEVTGLEIEGEHELFNLIKELSVAKIQYDRVAEALAEVEEKGYGIVKPEIEDLTFDEPELIKRGGGFGVNLKASAPSIHMIRADITTEVSPVVGTEKQCEELIDFLQEEFEENPDAIWDTDFLGRSLYDLVKDGIQTKLYRMPENAQDKLQDTLQKIVNEGSGGLICIIL